jgi:MFS family permease
LPGVEADTSGVTGGAAADAATPARGGRSPVLLILASAQFLMTLDSSVMNVSIKSVAADLGTTVTGIQIAITLYTLVMAAFMITGGKIGALIAGGGPSASASSSTASAPWSRRWRPTSPSSSSAGRCSRVSAPR